MPSRGEAAGLDRRRKEEGWSAHRPWPGLNPFAPPATVVRGTHTYALGGPGWLPIFTPFHCFANISLPLTLYKYYTNISYNFIVAIRGIIFFLVGHKIENLGVLKHAVYSIC